MTHKVYVYTRRAHCEILVPGRETPAFPSLFRHANKILQIAQGLNSHRNLSNKIAIPPPEEIISDNLHLRATNFEIRDHFSRPASLAEEKKNARALPPKKRVLVLFERRGKFSRENFFQLYFCSLRDLRDHPDSYGDGKGGGGEIEGLRIIPTF